MLLWPCACLGSLSCWKVNFFPKLQFFSGLKQVLLQHFSIAPSILSSILRRCPVPADEKHVYRMMLPPPYWDGVSWGIESVRFEPHITLWVLASHLTTKPSPTSLGHSHAFWQTPDMLSHGTLSNGFFLATLPLVSVMQRSSYDLLTGAPLLHSFRFTAWPKIL